MKKYVAKLIKNPFIRMLFCYTISNVSKCGYLNEILPSKYSSSALSWGKILNDVISGYVFLLSVYAQLINILNSVGYLINRQCQSMAFLLARDNYNIGCAYEKNHHSHFWLKLSSKRSLLKSTSLMLCTRIITHVQVWHSSIQFWAVFHKHCSLALIAHNK